MLCVFSDTVSIPINIYLECNVFIHTGQKNTLTDKKKVFLKVFPAALEIMCIFQTLPVPDAKRMEVKPGKNDIFKQY